MIQKKKFSDAIAANISVVGGLLSSTKNFADQQFQYIGAKLIYKGTLASQEEIDLGSINKGMFFLHCSSTGEGAIYISDGYPENKIIVVRDQWIERFKNYSIDNATFFQLGVKQSNGNLFIKNNSSSSLYVRIFCGLSFI